MDEIANKNKLLAKFLDYDFRFKLILYGRPWRFYEDDVKKIKLIDNDKDVRYYSDISFEYAVDGWDLVIDPQFACYRSLSEEDFNLARTTSDNTVIPLRQDPDCAEMYFHKGGIKYTVDKSDHLVFYNAEVTWSNDKLFIDVVDVIGEDFFSLLKNMTHKVSTRLHKHHLLIVNKIDASSVSKEKVISMFISSGIHVVFIGDVMDMEIPKNLSDYQ